MKNFLAAAVVAGSLMGTEKSSAAANNNNDVQVVVQQKSPEAQEPDNTKRNIFAIVSIAAGLAMGVLALRSARRPEREANKERKKIVDELVAKGDHFEKMVKDLQENNPPSVSRVVKMYYDRYLTFVGKYRALGDLTEMNAAQVAIDMIYDISGQIHFGKVNAKTAFPELEKTFEEQLKIFVEKDFSTVAKKHKDEAETTLKKIKEELKKNEKDTNWIYVGQLLPDFKTNVLFLQSQLKKEQAILSGNLTADTQVLREKTADLLEVAAKNPKTKRKAEAELKRLNMAGFGEDTSNMRMQQILDQNLQLAAAVLVLQNLADQASRTTEHASSTGGSETVGFETPTYEAPANTYDSGTTGNDTGSSDGGSGGGATGDY